MIVLRKTPPLKNCIFLKIVVLVMIFPTMIKMTILPPYNAKMTLKAKIHIFLNGNKWWCKISNNLILKVKRFYNLKSPMILVRTTILRIVWSTWSIKILERLQSTEGKFMTKITTISVWKIRSKKCFKREIWILSNKFFISQNSINLWKGDFSVQILIRKIFTKRVLKISFSKKTW